MSQLNPLWVDITWRQDESSEMTLELCQHFQMFSNLDVMMHLTCNGMSKEQIDNALDKCQQYGVRNILALRGDPPKEGSTTVNECGMTYAVDLIKYIRENYGDYFCIGCAGYPEVHTEAASEKDDLENLKAKIDAGADLIITQMFYDTKLFIEFVEKCKNIGITCPVIPGILPIQSYQGFMRMTSI